MLLKASSRHTQTSVIVDIATPLTRTVHDHSDLMTLERGGKKPTLEKGLGGSLFQSVQQRAMVYLYKDQGSPSDGRCWSARCQGPGCTCWKWTTLEKYSMQEGTETTWSKCNGILQKLCEPSEQSKSLTNVSSVRILHQCKIKQKQHLRCCELSFLRADTLQSWIRTLSTPNQDTEWRYKG